MNFSTEVIMPKPWEITPEEARAAGERKRERLRAGDRLAAPLFARQLAELDDADAFPLETEVEPAPESDDS